MDLALFDFDGTITRGDTWTPFMRRAVSPGRMLAGRALLAPVVVGYRCALFWASRGRQLAARIGFRGADVATVRRLGLAYATTFLPETLRREAVEQIEWHRSRGDQIVVVSASLDLYLRPWCDGHGFDCICAALKERSGRFTGRYAGPDCSGPEKARRVLERYTLGRFGLVFAYGDSDEDREMLALAHRRYYRWNAVAD